MAPPFVVVRKAPPSPASHPFELSTKATALSAAFVPADWPDQVAPPFTVRRTVPLPPTTQQVSASAQATP